MQFRQIHFRILLVTLVLGVALIWWNWPRGVAPQPREDRLSDISAREVFAPLPESADLPVPPPAVPLPENPRDTIPGEYTVFFQDAQAMADFIAAAEAAGLQIKGALPELLAVRVAGPVDALRRLVNDTAVVDYNHRVQAPEIPDPQFWQSQNLKPFRSEILKFLGVSVATWQSWGTGVTIAVLDTGWLGHDAVRPGKVKEIDLLGTPLEGDFAGHGTAVAGLVSSTLPYAPGLAPGSDLLAIRVLDGNGKGDAFTLAQGIIAAVQNGADIINMSLGSYGDSQVLRQAVEYAASHGVLMVAASGNDGLGAITFPAAYDQVIAVSAIDANGNRAPFSNFGNEVDLAAPGYQVYALWGEDEYIFFDGTSASAPLVSAIAARVLQLELASSPEQVRQVLLDQANETGPPGDDPQYGAGILNAERIESIGTPGIYDMALADLYPAIEESDGTTFPLYISLENRGTEYIPGTTVEILVNGKPYYYRFSGMAPGRVDSVQIPIPEDQLNQGQVFKVSAAIRTPTTYTDSRPSNNGSEISLSKPPEG